MLPSAAPVLADAFEAGTDVLPKTIQMNEDLADVFEALADFDDPLVRQGIDQLRGCRVAGQRSSSSPRTDRLQLRDALFRNAASLLSEGDSNGNWQRFRSSRR